MWCTVALIQSKTITITSRDYENVSGQFPIVQEYDNSAQQLMKLIQK